MEVIRGIGRMREFVREQRLAGKQIGLVPTMGYLHAGHLSLVQEALKACDVVVMSIFVNPLQFGVGEDYEDYPRDLTRDSELAEEGGVAAIFAPSVAEMYPPGGYYSYVDVEKLTEGLCGKSRPGHFRGVTTVVTKLFNIVQPDIAVFGQKDAQQAIVIQRMVRDLNMPLRIIVAPIMREADGLAMSSRNVYLSPSERKASLVLSRALNIAGELAANGERDANVLRKAIETQIQAEPLARIDYVEIVGAEDLKPVEILQGRILIALAVFFGKTRLIDNRIVEV
ncbi:MAG: pantoate--beta-alanine ligase [Syntrophomonadaceae bacterium]|nr:pantoate--beta-alanine ligase [Syntrophomonadaceae bacterium]